MFRSFFLRLTELRGRKQMTTSLELGKAQQGSRADLSQRTKREAGYFIRDWQELTGQVRQLIRKDPRYQAIKLAKAERHRLSTDVESALLAQQIETGKGDLQHD